MSKNSERVKLWRVTTKERMVESMGGRCVVCGYNKCNDALEFHHLESDKKDFGFGGLRSNIKGWKKIIEELRKCVLLCSNCHKEVHSSRCDTEVPKDAARFNEEYADYKVMEKLKTYCPICGKEKPSYNKTCSRKCSGKSKGKVDWENIDVVELLKEHKTYTAVGDILGVSGASVKKRYMKVISNHTS